MFSTIGTLRGKSLSAEKLASGTNKPAEDQSVTATPETDFNEDGEDDEATTTWNRHSPAGTELGGPSGYEPTTHGDWSRRGRVSDF